MPSAAKQTEIVRERKLRRRGSARKNKIALEGTTLSREELFKAKQ